MNTKRRDTDGQKQERRLQRCGGVNKKAYQEIT
jgi:hypothetical protein